MRYLVDSNILIYASQEGYDRVATFIAENLPSVSILTKIEVMGFHQLDQTVTNNFEKLFGTLQVIPLTDIIANKAIEIKRVRKTKLADAIIAATALTENLTLVTRNTDDFKKIDSLSILNIID